jgi:hypothetical protein
LAAVREWRPLLAAANLVVDIPAGPVVIREAVEDNHSGAEVDHTRAEARRFLVLDRISQEAAYNSRV